MRIRPWLLLAALFGLVGVIGVIGAGDAPAFASTDHCPDHEGNPGKVEGPNDDTVLPAGTEFCVKGGPYATGTLVADGVTTLKSHLDEVSDGNGVSYYVVYSSPDPDPDPQRLRLTFIQDCGVFTPPEGPWNPPAEVRFRLRNGNEVPVRFVLREAGAGVVDTSEIGSTLPPGDTFIDFPFGARTLILETYNAAGEKVGEDTKAGGDTYLTTDDAGEKCLPETPEPTVETGDWIDGTYECDDETVAQTRTVSTTTYVWDGERFVGVTETVTETRTRDLTDEEFIPCPSTPPVTPPEPPVTPPEPPVTPPEPPVTPPEPPVTPPAVGGDGGVAPEPDVDAAGPVPPAQTPNAAPAADPTAAADAPAPATLPVTGSSSWAIAASALATLLAGLGLVRLGRRAGGSPVG